MKILCSNPIYQYKSHKQKIDQAIKKVLNKGTYINGKECNKFELEFSRFVGMPYCLGVANGTDALEIAFKIIDISKGDEVITTCHTAAATIASIINVGAKPVIVDIDKNTFNLNTKLLEKAFSKKTKAIVAVHIYGNPCEIEIIKKFSKKNKIYLIEDCSQAHGAKLLKKQVGSFGDMSCFSFYPTKNLGAIGDGGAILFKSKKLKNKASLLREYGWKNKFYSKITGRNSRLDELQASILRVKLKKLYDDNLKRIKLASRYIEKLKKIIKIKLPLTDVKNYHVYHLFVIKTQIRDKLKKFLEKKGIFSTIHYPVPIHKQEGFMKKIKFIGSKKNIENITSKILSLPIYPELKFSEQNYIIKSLEEFYE
jgi:dTDP-4-amino-4,6-dideoxygalactose transaminase